MRPFSLASANRARSSATACSRGYRRQVERQPLPGTPARTAGRSRQPSRGWATQKGRRGTRAQPADLTPSCRGSCDAYRRGGAEVTFKPGCGGNCETFEASVGRHPVGCSSRQIVSVSPSLSPVIDRFACAASKLKELGGQIALGPLPQVPDVLATVDEKDRVRVDSALQNFIYDPCPTPEPMTPTTSKTRAASRNAVEPPCLGGVRRDEHAVGARSRSSEPRSPVEKPQKHLDPRIQSMRHPSIEGCPNDGTPDSACGKVREEPRRKS